MDCSSALLHPLVEHANAANESFTPLEESGAPHENVGAAQVEARGEEALQEWFGELKAACLRVEKLQKKRSGASELAITRRLGLLPKRKVFGSHCGNWTSRGRICLLNPRHPSRFQVVALPVLMGTQLP